MTTIHSNWLSAEELLMEPLAIRLSEQTTLAKSLVMAGHPKDDNQLAVDKRANNARQIAGMTEPTNGFTYTFGQVTKIH
jgi:hypothetical protein